jgi:hypothetical protein
MQETDQRLDRQNQDAQALYFISANNPSASLFNKT